MKINAREKVALAVSLAVCAGSLVSLFASILEKIPEWSFFPSIIAFVISLGCVAAYSRISEDSKAEADAIFQKHVVAYLQQLREAAAQENQLPALPCAQ